MKSIGGNLSISSRTGTRGALLTCRSCMVRAHRSRGGRRRRSERRSARPPRRAGGRLAASEARRRRRDKDGPVFPPVPRTTTSPSRSDTKATSCGAGPREQLLELGLSLVAAGQAKGTERSVDRMRTWRLGHGSLITIGGGPRRQENVWPPRSVRGATREDR
jgi:hypothetical protein